MTGEERVFDNERDRLFFSDREDITSETTYFIHASDVVAKAFQQAGIFSNFVFQPTEPTDTTRVWVQNDVDPGIVRIYDANTSSWIPATFERVFNIVSVMTIEPWSNTQGYVTGNVVRASNDVVYIALLDTGPPHPPVDPISPGQVAWEILAVQTDTENEFTVRQTFSANISWPADRPQGVQGYDLDTLITPGRYSIDTLRDSNIPGNITAGILEVHQREEQTMRGQFLFGVDNSLWFRTGDQDPIVWQPWQEVVFDFSGDHTFTGINTFDGLININRNAVWRSVASTTGSAYDLDDLILSGRYTIDGARDTNLPGNETAGLLEVYSVTGDGLVAQLFAGAVSMWYRRGEVTGQSVNWQPFVQFASATGGDFDFTADHTYSGINTFQAITELEGGADITGPTTIANNAEWRGLVSGAGGYDLDALLTPGRYGIDSTRDSNLPDGTTQGVLEVQRRGSTNFYGQIFYTDAAVFYRSSVGTNVVWSEWEALGIAVDEDTDFVFGGDNIFNGTSTFNGAVSIPAPMVWRARHSDSSDPFNADTIFDGGRYYLGVLDTGKPTSSVGLMEIYEPSSVDRRHAVFWSAQSVWFREARIRGGDTTFTWDPWRPLAREDLTVERTGGAVGAAVLPAGRENQRPASPEAGYLRWNTDTVGSEVFDGSGWRPIGGDGLVPIGAILPVFGTTAPAGTVLLTTARQTLSRTVYPDLWEFIQSSGNLASSEGAAQAYQFGPGDGSTTFSVFGLDGVFLRASGTNAAPLGQGQTDGIRNITGSFICEELDGGAFASPVGAFGINNQSGGGSAVQASGRGEALITFDASRIVPTADDNRPVNATVNYAIIAFQAITAPASINAAEVVAQVNANQVAISNLPLSNQYTSNRFAYELSDTNNITHGLGGIPDLVQVRLINKTAEHGFSPDEHLIINNGLSASEAAREGGVCVRLTSTQILFFSGGNAVTVIAPSGDNAQLTPANWDVQIRAWA